MSIVSEKVNHPVHYNDHPSGVEAIDLIEHMVFNLGNAFKYIVRHPLKGGYTDLNKAIWYLERQLTLPEIKGFKVSPEIEESFAKFIKAERNKYLRQVYENIFKYHFHEAHQCVIWDSLDILHKIEQEIKERKNT